MRKLFQVRIKVLAVLEFIVVLQKLVVPAKAMSMEVVVLTYVVYVLLWIVLMLILMSVAITAITVGVFARSETDGVQLPEVFESHCLLHRIL
jgi:hypothetical protein